MRVFRTFLVVEDDVDRHPRVVGPAHLGNVAAIADIVAFGARHGLVEEFLDRHAAAPFSYREMQIRQPKNVRLSTTLCASTASCGAKRCAHCITICRRSKPGWGPSIAFMAANTAPTRLWPKVESDAAYFSGCPPGGRAHLAAPTRFEAEFGTSET